MEKSESMARMRQWDAAIVVLFDVGYRPDQDVGKWMKYDAIASEIKKRNLVSTKARNFAQSIGMVMREKAPEQIEADGEGYYRIRSRKKTEEFLKSRGFWIYVESIQIREIETSSSQEQTNDVTPENRSQKDFSSELKHHSTFIPEELPATSRFIEGSACRISVNRYERDKDARNACLAQNGYQCIVCNFDFESEFGEIGKQFIHVHHLKPLSQCGGEYSINAVRDLCPICPNCHAMAHRREPPYEIAKLQEFRRLAQIGEKSPK